MKKSPLALSKLLNSNIKSDSVQTFACERSEVLIKSVKPAVKKIATKALETSTTQWSLEEECSKADACESFISLALWHQSRYCLASAQNSSSLSHQGSCTKWLVNGAIFKWFMNICSTEVQRKVFIFHKEIAHEARGEQNWPKESHLKC